MLFYHGILMLVLLRCQFSTGQRQDEIQTSSDCNCAETRRPIPEGVTGKPEPIERWSPCVSNGIDSRVCFGGKRKRKLRCNYMANGNSSVPIRQIDTLNILAKECYETSVCQMPENAVYCEGSWSPWSNSGQCNCTKKTRIQSRYCHEFIDGEDSPRLTHHCPGSNGKNEQIRPAPCSDGCKPPAKPGLHKTTSGEVRITTRFSTIYENTTSYQIGEPPTTSTEKSNDEDAEPVSTQTIIVGAAAGTVAFAALILLIVVMQMKRKQNKKVENNNYSESAPPPPPIGSVPTTLNRGPVSNRIYVPNEDYQMAYRPYPPAANARRAATTRPPHPPRPPLPAPMRDRSVTVDGMLGINQQFVEQPNGYCGLGEFPATSNCSQYSGAYEVPMLDSTENEIYSSINDDDPNVMRIVPA